MCGILFVLTNEEEEYDKLQSSILPKLHRRGPDAQSTLVVAEHKYQLYFHGTVLHLRGQLVKQPLHNEDGDVMLWNGEVFGGVHVDDYANDTEVIFEKLQELVTDTEYVNFFAAIRGPWAFVYYSATSQKLWYGRDYFGRRSLLHLTTDNIFMLSSVGHIEMIQDCAEVPAKTLYCLNLKNFNFGQNVEESLTTFPLSPTFIMGPTKALQAHRCLTAVRSLHQNDCSSKVSDSLIICSMCGRSVSQLKNLCIETSNHIRCDPNRNEKKSLKHSIDIVVHNDTSSHQFDGIKCCACIHQHDSNSQVSSDTACSKYEQDTVDSVNLTSQSINVPETFLSVLEQAVRTRVLHLPRFKREVDESTSLLSDVRLKNMLKANVGILFSGGIDSAVLAALAHRCVPLNESIDLINVAFQQKPHVAQNVKKKYQKIASMEESPDFNVPDRLTGRRAILELSDERQWNLVEVDVSLEELQKERTDRIAGLVYPLNSVLDDSIGCAIWFAARGIGKRYTITSEGDLQLQEENYKSPVKVVLTGMGADEQLGGYARHRTKFESSGWTGLIDEMNMEIERISSRNLGRDDRCISDHGRESRFPYLDENVVKFLKDTPACVKCDPRLPRGEGEKILLREVAEILNLSYCSKLPKRAIQFGSKIAKLESRKEKGSDTCSRLK